MNATTTDDKPVQGGLFAVVGATGQQGGATARALLRAGARVRALTRNPRAQAATALADAGAEVVTADIADAHSLRAAFTGVDGVFAMTTFAGSTGPAEEVEHGRLIGDAARDAAVPHVVYSSVGGAERQTAVPHFESKRRVEEYLAALGFPLTVVRPTFFMENFARGGPQDENGVLVLRLPLPPGVPLQMIGVRDVGAVAAAALLDPAAVPGGAVEIAGDELTGEQIAAAFAERAGLPSRFEPLPLSALASDPDLQAMFTWFAALPAYQADFAATRALAPDVQDLPAWLTAQA